MSGDCILHKDTTEDDLKELMSAAGLQEPQCYKFKAKDGHEFQITAFQGSRNKYYDEATWPEGCERGDWVFYKK